MTGGTLKAFRAPEPDELLSSWLIRNALIFGCDPLVLTGHLWPGERIWKRDIDRRLASSQITRLLLTTPFDETTVRATQLTHTIERFALPVSWNCPIIPWLVPVGSRNLKRTISVSYCPQCLSEDPTPYLRRAWRFAWHFACPKHNIYLQAMCNQCNAPLEPQRLHGAHESMAFCASCCNDLRSGDRIFCDNTKVNVILWLDTVLSSNFGKIEGNLVPAASYFEHLRLLIRLVRAASRNEKSAAARAMARLNLNPPLLISQSRLEILVPQKRAELLYAATRLCELEAGKIMNALLDAGVTRSSDLRPLAGAHCALHEFWWQLPASRPALRQQRSNKTGIERRPRSRRYVEREWERVTSKARRVNA